MKNCYLKFLFNQRVKTRDGWEARVKLLKQNTNEKAHIANRMTSIPVLFQKNEGINMLCIENDIKR